jgi:Fe-S-cluster containining protein
MSNCSTCKAKCCIAWGHTLNFTTEDIEKWKDHEYSKYIVNGEIWFKDGKRLARCPFLSNDSSSCTIYPKEGDIDMRPSICSDYPSENRVCLNDSMDTVEFSGYKIDIAPVRSKRNIA